MFVSKPKYNLHKTMKNTLPLLLSSLREQLLQVQQH